MLEASDDSVTQDKAIDSLWYAHSPNEAGQWDMLPDHLKEVARLAQQFAAAFGGSELAQQAGLLHDLGKYSSAFQKYIEAAAIQDAKAKNSKEMGDHTGAGGKQAAEQDAEIAGKVDHSTAGAQHAMATMTSPAGRLLAYLISGHHSGLLDAGSAGSNDVPGTLAARLVKVIEPVDGTPDWLLKGQKVRPPELEWCGKHSAIAFQMAFFTRMLFSALVDADFLATEAHFDQARVTARSSRNVNWEDWRDRLDADVFTKQQKAKAERGESKVLQHRQRIYEACCNAAMDRPGFFSLTVPTGGGKTLASLAMAIRHVIAHNKQQVNQQHGLRRIIYAMPFTSIIEQNAQVFRDTLGDDADLILEHHSSLDPERITKWNRLASENWDAPLVVTTNVQLYESLFAAKTSACRKLHRIAGSVIVLDEAQSLPVDLLEPTLAALAELVRNYNCTVILCTATQPAVNWREDFKIGLEDVREVIGKPDELAADLSRVTINDVGVLTEDGLAARLAQERQVLAIVDKRARAASLLEKLRQQDVQAFHLSAAMCPVHRSAILQKVRETLVDGDRPCRVVSTQLIEAGVDVDFAVVYRALAGLDAIAQAAGRCNREGKLATGQMYLFQYEGGAAAVPKGQMREAAKAAMQLLGQVDDLLSPQTQRQYFELLYWSQSHRWDKKEVMDCFKEPAKLLFDFRTAAERYRLIDSEQKPIFIPWGEEGERLMADIQNTHRPMKLEDYRKAQRYQVQVPVRVWHTLVAQGDVEDIPDRVPVLMSSVRYDEAVGLKTDDIVLLDGDWSVI